MSESITLDESLFSMFRMNARPIPCPFAGPPFTFSYFRGRGTCQVPENQAESCTDESKLLLKYQACPDIEGTESTSMLSIYFFIFLYPLSFILLYFSYYYIIFLCWLLLMVLSNFYNYLVNYMQITSRWWKLVNI